jgi:hypothetical protein
MTLEESSNATVEAIRGITEDLAAARALVMSFNGGWNFAMHSFISELRSGAGELLELSEDERDAQLLGATSVMVIALGHWVGCCLAQRPARDLAQAFSSHLRFVGQETFSTARKVLALMEAEGATKQ